MTIASKLLAVNTIKGNLRTSLANKGATISEATPFGDYPELIDTLPSGGISITGETTVTGTASENITAGDVVARKYQGGSIDSFSSDTNFSSLNLGIFNNIAFSTDGKYVALTKDSDSGFKPTVVRKNEDGTYTALALPSVAANSFLNTVAFFPNTYHFMVCSKNGSPGQRFVLYKIVDDVPTFVGYPDMIIGGSISVSKFEQSDYSGTVVGFSTNGIALFTVNTSTDTVSSPSGVTISLYGYENSVGCVAKNGKYIFGFRNGNTAKCYEIVSEALVDVSDKIPPHVFSYQSHGADINEAENACVMRWTQYPYSIFYTKVNGTWTENTSVTKDTSTSVTCSPKFLPSGRVLISGGKYYKCDSLGVWDTTAYNLPFGYPNAQNSVMAISSDGNVLGIPHGDNNILVGSIGGTPTISKYTYPNFLISDIGYATSTVTSGNTATMKSIIRNPSNYPV